MATTITKSIGTSGRDYSTLAAFFAAIPSNLVTADEQWVGEVYNDSELSFSGVQTLSGKTTDATRNIILKAAAGQGFADHASKLTNPLFYDATKGAAITISGNFEEALVIAVAYTEVRGLQIKGTGVNQYALVKIDAANCTISDCILHYHEGANNVVKVNYDNTTIINCLLYRVAAGGCVFFSFTTSGTLSGCTLYGAGSDTGVSSSFASTVVKSCFIANFATTESNISSSSSNNASTTTIATGSSNQASLTFSSQCESTTDFRAKAGGALINNGVTVGGMSLDILGQTRSGTPTIGAHEYAAADTTPPVLTTPTGSATGPTTATVGATTDEGNGTLYAVVTTSTTQPSVAQIKAGQTHTGAAAPWGGSVAVSSTGAKTLSATGLTAATAYYAHLVHSDAAANDSNRVSSSTFTTSSVAGLTSSPLKNNTGTLRTSEPFEAYVSTPTTGALVLKKTGLTSHATTGVVTFTDAALTAATSYRVVWRQTTTGAEGLETLTAA